MWETLIKINPSFISWCIFKTGKEFNSLMELALEKGYVPSYADLKRNDEMKRYVYRNDTLLNSIIKKNPKELTRKIYTRNKKFLTMTTSIINRCCF